METLGARIKRIRKEKKLTQSQVVGDNLTKGMLSLIENNKAKPSMESLNYIAQQLQVAPQQLLIEVEIETLRDVLAQVEKLHYVKDNEEICKLVAPYIDNMPRCYEGARLLRYYARCLRADWQDKLAQALTILYDMNAMNDWVDGQMEWTKNLMQENKFSETLQHALMIYAECEREQYVITVATKIELQYLIAMLYMGVNDFDLAKLWINKAIALSHQEQTFYYAGDMYRLAAIIATEHRDLNLYEKYIQKTQQYRDFVDTPEASITLAACKTHHYLYYAQYTEALAQLEDANIIYRKLAAETHFLLDYDYIYLNYKGRILYLLGDKAGAYTVLQQMPDKLPSYLRHPYDRMEFCKSYAIKVLLLVEHQKNTQAKKLLQFLVEEIAILASLPVPAIVAEAIEAVAKVK